MADKKEACSLSVTVSHQDPGSTTNTHTPPPYTDEPPAYSSLVATNYTDYPSVPLSSDYMDKLPFEDSSSRSYYPQAPPTEVLTYPTPYINQQTANQQPSFHYPPNPPPPTSQQVSRSTAPHKALLQPTSSRIVETTSVGRRTTKSHVTDLETGKEYFVKEKTSRNGRHNKAVIKEVGGPRTYIKETPTRTVVCQKK